LERRGKRRDDVNDFWKNLPPDAALLLRKTAPTLLPPWQNKGNYHYRQVSAERNPVAHISPALDQYGQHPCYSAGCLVKGRYFDTVEEAKAWCDELLWAAGYLLDDGKPPKAGKLNIRVEWEET
jgi:hypothetical protein